MPAQRARAPQAELAQQRRVSSQASAVLKLAGADEGEGGAPPTICKSPPAPGVQNRMRKLGTP